MSRIGEVLSDEVRRDLFEALRRPIRPFRGEEVRSQGDGLMVAFRSSSADALACAAAMQRAVAQLSVPDSNQQLEIRVGVSGGEVTHEEDDWYGAPVVEAARLCAAASPSQVLVADRVLSGRSRICGLPLRSVGSLALKGLPGELPTSELVWSSETQRSRSATMHVPPPLNLAGEPPLVGRAVEISVLDDVWEAVKVGASPVVLLQGRARVGRTRLISEWSARVNRAGDTILYGSVSRRGGPVQALADALRRYLLWVPRDVAIRLSYVPNLTSIVPSLAARLTGEHSASSQALEPDVVADAVAAVLADGAARRPTLLVLEDLNWADPVLIDTVIQLVTSHRVPSLAVAATYRTLEGQLPAVLGPLVDKLQWLPSATLLDLEPLSVDEVGQLMAGMGVGAAKESPRSLIRNVSTRTLGLPGDVVEIARSMADVDAEAEEALNRCLARASPFKGLLAYEPEDFELFFGRSELVSHILDRVAQERFVVIAGPSGCGKSSLVRAGVVPRLGSPAVVMSPGVAPLRSLDDALALADSGRTIVVDQLEELFALCDDHATRLRFLDRLLHYVDAKSGALIITVRGDFYGHCALHADFGARVGDSTVLVGPMSDDEARLAIEGPAGVAGLELEVGLADVVLGDISDTPTALPLLSHALLETWRNRRGSRLTVDDYRDTGGVRGAIARSAERVFTAQLDGDDQTLARDLLLRLVEPSDAGEHTRRPVSLAAMRTALGPRIETVLDVLVGARLLTVDEDVVELAHEALVREWPRFRGWIDEEREQLRVIGQLSIATSDWARTGRPDSDLYRGARLDAALELVDRGVPLTDTEREFTEASKQRREADRRTLHRTNRRLRRLLAVAAAGLAVALVAGVIAVSQQRTAEDRRRIADGQRRASEIALLSAQARELADVQLDVASLLAMEARLRSDGPDAVDALLDVLRAQPAIEKFTSFEGRALRSVEVGADGRRGAMLDGDQLVRFTMPELITEPPIIITDAGTLAMSPDSNRIAVTNPEGVTVLNASTGEVETSLPLSETLGRGALPDVTWVGPSRIALRGSSTAIRIFDLTTNSEPGEGVLARGSGVMASDEDGQRLAVAAERAGTIELASESTVEVFDADTGEVIRRFVVPSARVSRVSFQPGGNLLAVGTDDSGLFVIDSESGTIVIRRPLAVGASARFSPDGGALAVRDEAGRVTVLNTTGEVVLAPVAQAGELRDVFFSPEAEMLLVDAVTSLISVRLDGREPLATAPFGEPGQVPGAVRTDGQVVWGVQVPSGSSSDQSDAVSVAYDPADGQELDTLPKSVAAYGPGDAWVYVIDPYGGPYAVVDPTSGATIATSHANFGQRIALGQFDGTASTVFWATHDGERLDIRQLPGLSPVVTALRPLNRDILTFALANGGDRIAYASLEQDHTSKLYLFDLHSGDAVTAPIDWPDQLALPRSLAFSADGTTLAVADDAGGIALLHLDSGELSRERFQGLRGPVVSVQFTNDDRLLAVGQDGMVWFFDATSASSQSLGPPIPWLTRQDEYSLVGGYQPSGDLLNRHLLTTDPLGLRLWNIDPTTWFSIACERAGRNLTAEEWARYLPADEPYRPTCARYASD